MQGKKSVRRYLIAVMSLATVCVAGECSHAAEHSTNAAQVYECRVNGQRTFSDQPCANDATKREVTATNTMSAREAAIGYRSSAPQTEAGKGKASSDQPDPHDKRLGRCNKLSRDKQTLNSRLRAGYNNNQGERLRERLRKIDADYYDLRCSSLR